MVNQLSLLYTTFCKSLDDGLEVRAVFFDISKAFDKVWHKGLLRICGALFRWIESYLSNRRQRVILPGTLSTWANTNNWPVSFNPAKSESQLFTRITNGPIHPPLTMFEL